ncbi:hypothetical protein Pla52o_00790 [Novipirellula galeiformis]|uniref:DUF4149 domain-containing protein n=1 Tax=Novipirellula galeiformis TaxID=2528004 RepID=A0A5C6CT49_9BACT|nr:hypothetical protein [Novipirellula galeiformis]TWU26226.1 hypothetical protein Pla52o_00790 [Novipirellula galeiformis]
MNIPDIVNQLKPLVDAGLCVLIWLVQVIIYPSFEFCDVKQFKYWHSRYTQRISWFVVPLMFCQLGVHGWLIVHNLNALSLFAASLIATAWIATFVLSVPCHHRLQRSGYDVATIRRLVKTNWLRTVAWTTVFVLDLYTRI